MSQRRQAAALARRSLRRRRQEHLDRLFLGRLYRVVEKIELPKDTIYENPLGGHGRVGWIIAEVGDSAHELVVGDALLRIIDRDYGALVKIGFKC